MAWCDSILQSILTPYTTIGSAQGFHGMRASFPCTLECSEEHFLSAIAEIKVQYQA